MHDSSRPDNPLFSIIIPARNEEHELPRCLAAIRCAQERLVTNYPELQSHPCPLEIIVVLNRCTDRTAAVAQAAGCVLAQDDRKNLACIRNTGARLARAPRLITVDADSRMSANMLLAVYRCLERQDVAGGGVLILPERYSLGIVITALYLLPIALYWRISGGLFFCWREHFEAISGFDERLVSVEDIDFARRLRRYAKGKNLRFVNLLRAHIVSSCRKFDRLGDWYFVLRPHKVLSLLRGRNQQEADKVWYEFPR
jgi:glycosyltransferase involved in cell wall biosynthesis